MNYKVLYRKYRPDGFDTLIGQKHVVEILKNSVLPIVVILMKDLQFLK